MSKKLKGKYKRLFKRIEHGNRKHRNWLYDKMFEFQEEEERVKALEANTSQNQLEDALKVIIEENERTKREIESKVILPPLKF